MTATTQRIMSAMFLRSADVGRSGDERGRRCVETQREALSGSSVMRRGSLDNIRPHALKDRADEGLRTAAQEALAKSGCEADYRRRASSATIENPNG